MTEKRTKRTNFNELLNIAEVRANAELVKFIENEIALLDKKTAKGRGNKKDEPVRDRIEKLVIEYLTESTMNMTELSDVIEPIIRIEFPNSEIRASVNRISAIVKPYIEKGQIERTIIKGRPYFKVVKA